MEPKNTDESAVFTTITNASDQQSWLSSLLRQVRESYEARKNPPVPVHVTAAPDPDAVGLLIEQPSALGSMWASISGMIDDWRHPRTYSVDPAEVQEIWGGRRYKTKLLTFIGYAALVGGFVVMPRAVSSSTSDETIVQLALTMPDKVVLPDKPIEPKPVEKMKPKPPTNPKPSTLSGGGEAPRRAAEIPPPPKPADTGGGGGGGGQQLTEASKGEAPKFADKQLVPPTIVAMNDNPVLVAPQSLVALNAPKLTLDLAQPKLVGDPLGVPNAPPSAGTGTGNGIGSGRGNGVGKGSGPGLGEGEGGGTGGGRGGNIPSGVGAPCVGPNCGNGGGTVRGNITQPTIIRQTKPPYSEDARKNKIQGTVILDITVREDGTVDRNTIKLVRKQGYGLDESAIEDVKAWLFRPATQDGRPIASIVRIEVNFALR